MVQSDPGAVADERLILIVDDDPSVCRWLGAALGLEGYRVLEAANGYEALSLAESYQPDVILLDIMMPGMSGLEVLDRLRESPAAAQPAPVIIISALGSDTDQWEGYRHGATCYVPKPVETNQLISVVNELLD